MTVARLGVVEKAEASDGVLGYFFWASTLAK